MQTFSCSGRTALLLLALLTTPLSAFSADAIRDVRMPKGDIDAPYDVAMQAYENGYQSYRQGHFNQAEDSFIEALRHEPNLIKAHYWLGKLYHEQGRLEDAIFHWEEVERLNTLIKDRRAALQIENNEYPAYSQMLRVSQKTKDAREAFERGLNLLDKGHWDGAEVEIRLAVQLYPGNHRYLLQLARILWDKGEKQASVKFYRDLLSKRDVDFASFKEGIERMLQCEMKYVAAPLMLDQKQRFAAEPAFAAMALNFSNTQDYSVTAPGKIIRRADGQVIINLGLDDGLNLSDEYSLDLRAFKAGEPLKDPDSGKIIGRGPDRPSADLLLTKVYKNTSWALIRREYGSGVKAGDLIEFKKTFR